MKRQMNYEFLLDRIDVAADKAKEITGCINEDLITARTATENTAHYILYRADSWLTLLAAVIDYTSEIKQDIENFRAQEVRNDEIPQI